MFHQAFPIDSNHIEDLPSDAIKAIKKYKLRYLVAKVPKVPAYDAMSWLNESGLVVFKFWAVNYPSVQMYSGNNPDVI
jgi:hypothetical protein